jgi:predicted metalloprotease with PDZ domain
MKPGMKVNVHNILGKVIKETIMWFLDGRKLCMMFLLLLPALLLGSCKKDDQHTTYISKKSGAWLGVRVVSLSEKMLKNMDIEKGVKITRIFADSPADKAGLEVDDVILAYNGSEIASPDDLVNMVGRTGIGEQAEITYLRSGEKKFVTATIAERENTRTFRFLGHPERFSEEKSKEAWLGVETVSLTDQLRSYFKAPGDMGVLVQKVKKDSPADKAGILAGDVIIGVADREIHSTGDLSRSIRYYNPDEEVDIKIIRDKKEKIFRVKLGETDRHYNFRFYGDIPEGFEIPDIDINVPDIDFDHDIRIEIDKEKLRQIEKDIKQELKEKNTELEEKMDVLREKMEKLNLNEI